MNKSPPGPSLTLIVISFVVMEQVLPLRFEISNLLYWVVWDRAGG